MIKHLLKNSRTSTFRLFFTICLGGGLVLLGVSSLRRPGQLSVRAVENQKIQRQQTRASGPVLQGAAARQYLEQTGEGQSLMQAITAARFGLKRQERGPFGEAGAGYLGMSHEQNLNAWFAEDGVTVRPTVAESERGRAWRMDMRLKAYGYGNDLIPAPPIVAQRVKDNRIEYERAADFKSQISNLKFQNDLLFQSAIGNRQSTLTEWYENRSEGIEQGFTLAARPERNLSNSEQPLRLLVSLNGDLRARLKDEGHAIELTDGSSKPALSYSKLSALDADGKQLAAHMETNANGSEVVLVVDDRGASYPIVIDPIVATLEKILEAPFGAESGAQFGDAIAIDGDRAVVGMWLADFGSVDSGIVYFFGRTGSAWKNLSGLAPGQFQPNARCGYSVAIQNGTAVFGCPGMNGNAGTTWVFDTTILKSAELTPGTVPAGSFFGASVAIFGANVIVGSPSFAVDGKVNAGAVFRFILDSNLNVTSQGMSILTQPVQNARFGDAVAIFGNTILVAMPGRNQVVDLTQGTALQANDSAPGDLFGQNIALSANTAVIGAPANDEKGTDAGAAYVFVRDSSGQWSQQQKLMASDGRPDDIFGYYSVAIEGNTIVVGARRHDLSKTSDPPLPNDNSGAAYIFMRDGSVWTQQTKLTAGGFFRAPGDQFGTSVGISGDTVIVSAPHETSPQGTVDAGVTYVYRLNCVPPSSVSALFAGTFKGTACPGKPIDVVVAASNPTNVPLTYQWRKNGINIPSATNAEFQISSASASDAGSYDVVVSNACGSAVSDSFTIGIHTFGLNPTSQNFGAGGSNGIVNVSSTGSCGWTAVSNSPFITITSGASGNVPGTVGFTVAANAGLNQRTGAMTIGDKTFTVTQDAAAPTPTPTPTPTPNVVQFSASSYSIGEDCTSVTITVNRIGDTTGAASVDYNTSDVTATERRDYTTAVGKLRFAAGETAKSFVVLINEDSYVEGPESFNVNLSNPSGAGLGAAVATVQINDDPTEPAANSIDDPATFVGEHYHDFLNRQSDDSGLAFWTNNLTSCGTDPACIQLKRVNVSAAYFLSIEFQQTGYLVERFYKTAYGNGTGGSTLGGSHQLPVPIIRLQEFLRDTRQIGQDVIVGQPGWENALENNKQIFSNDFSQQSRFTAAFPPSLTAAQFVDALNANAGSPLSAAERNQLVNDLSTGAKTRSQVLRAIAEHPNLVSAESNRAFVLMQYFGYLRRNPNDAPDADYTGYDFWLAKLSQFNGDFVGAEMVKAFITSSEYRQRFGSQ